MTLWKYFTITEKGSPCSQLSRRKRTTISEPAPGVMCILLSSHRKCSSNPNLRHIQAALITKAKLTPVTPSVPMHARAPVDLTSLKTDWATSTGTNPSTAHLACSALLLCHFIECSPRVWVLWCSLSRPLHTDHLGGLWLSRHGHCVPS